MTDVGQTSTFHVAGLYHYPLKSARGQSLSEVDLHPFGMGLDRRWVLIDHDGRFLSQRTCLKLGSIDAYANGMMLTLTCGTEAQVVSADPAKLVNAQVWGDWIADCFGVPEQVNQWLSAYLGQSVRLVYCPDSAVRVVDERYAGTGYHTAFSDGFPILVISQSSLDELSRRWGQMIDVRRFRPNLVIAGDCAPFAEDDWQSIRIGDVQLDLVKPCSRCVIPGLDPDGLTQTTGFLRFLAGERRRDDGKTYLGQNAVWHRVDASDTAEQGSANAQSTENQAHRLAENSGLLHTKKEASAFAPSAHRQGVLNLPSIYVGQAVHVIWR